MQLLQALADDGGVSSLRTIAAQLGLAPATAYRLAGTLVAAQMILPVGRGRYLPGPGMCRLAANASLRPVLVALGRGIVCGLARATRCSAHLGIFENDMVTYLVKADGAGQPIFTEEGKQLEAYCSGIGKVLLAALPEAELSTYLMNGPFVRLTSNTITDPARLRAEIELVRDRAYGQDDEEVLQNLRCLAVGVPDLQGRSVAALSISYFTADFEEGPAMAALRDAACRLQQAIFRPNG
jgi:DNA-binding IclR family transcriptional regulator